MRALYARGSMRLIILTSIVLDITGCATSTNDIQIEPNPSHFGCWKYLTNEVGSVTNTLKLCISNDKVHFSIYYPNTASGGNETTCQATGDLIGASGSDTRLYQIGVGVCTNGRETVSAFFSCSKAGSFLECEDMILNTLNGEVKFDLRNTFSFSYEKSI